VHGSYYWFNWSGEPELNPHQQLGDLPMRSLGIQIVAELYDCARSRLGDVAYVESAMVSAAQLAGATIVTRTFHQFSPYGVSGAVIIAESHLAIHTWPEHGYAAVDLFTCGDTVSATTAVQHLREAFAARQISTMEIRRGQLEMMRPPVADRGQPQIELARNCLR
jgi:S-adenosylmethionine decarboxylase